MGANVRAIAKTYLSKVLNELAKKADAQLQSERDGTIFTDLCAEDLVGTKFTTIQDKLKANWARGESMTSCLSFVLTYAKRIGYQMQAPGGYMASFEVDTDLAKNPPAKGYAWVPFGGDKRPQYGDVVLFNRGHIGVSLEVNDKTWYTLESGQGGKNYGYDIILKLTQSYSERAHLGWVDLDLYFGPKPAPPTPQQPPAGKTGRLWLNHDDKLVHPDAPTGGGGPGAFAQAGPLGTGADDGTFPHPWSPQAYRNCVDWPSYGKKLGLNDDRDESQNTES